MRRIALAAFFAWSLGLILGGSPPAIARPAPPRDFFGVVPQTGLTSADFEQMHGVVGTLRIPVYWPGAEPQAGKFDLSALDATVSAAAASGVRVLPFVYGTPDWISANPARPPLSAAAESAWAGFLRTLVLRYGPRGELWDKGLRRVPIRQWQIWNEPNFRLFWRPRPSPSGYAHLLRVSARAIRSTDSGAQVVAAGLAPVEGGMLPWSFLRKLYRVRGVNRSFDLAAVHPYSSTLGGMVYQVRKARQVMAAAGDGSKPLLISELGVASDSSLPTAFNWGMKGQASFLRRAYGRLIRERDRWHIVGVDWYAWRDSHAADPHCVFCEYSGLFDARGKPKPAWWALRSFVASPQRSG